MEYFEVKEERTDLWSVSSNGYALYFFATEKDARSAALRLAAESCAAGSQATVVIRPSARCSLSHQIGAESQFSGM